MAVRDFQPPSGFDVKKTWGHGTRSGGSQVPGHMRFVGYDQMDRKIEKVKQNVS